MEEKTTLLLKLPRNVEVTPEAAQTFLATLTGMETVSGLKRLRGGKPQSLALEIYLINQQIMFMVTCDSDLTPFVEAQLRSNYPLVLIEHVQDPLASMDKLEVAALSLKKGNYYPIAVFTGFTEIDPMGSVLTVLSKGDPSEFAVVQIALMGAGGGWQSAGQSLAEKGGGKTEEGNYLPHPDATIIKEKISYPGLMAVVHLAANHKRTLKELKNAFGVFARSDGNGFGGKKSGILSGKSRGLNNLRARNASGGSILNIVELATLWHLPSEKIKIPSIVWGTSVLSEPPDNLPIATEMSDEDKRVVNFFAKTQFKNQEAVFGIKDADRPRHIWSVGKSGTGKSTMIENMVIDDIKNDRAVALIDPHGDSCEVLLDYVPNHRVNDVVYFNPADRDNPIVINPLEVVNREEAELVVSGMMTVFTKIWANVWSARMEYIMRNTLLTLAQIEGTTMKDVLTILSNNAYRSTVLQKIQDESLIRYWKDEFEKMPDRLQKEAISPIQNKVGQFVTSPMIRRIIGQPKSSVQLDDVMNGRKIMFCNLSQGRLGEDNSSLLGAVLITKFQLAAMRRVDIPKEERLPFYLYVDEFQNFATESFIKILSEARKYGLNLMLANQYMAQIPEEVQKAILGNAGTLISFAVGAEDAKIIHAEFAEVFEENDLVNLSNYQIAIKLLVDWQSTRPFLANTLPLPATKNGNRNSVISMSKEQWGAKLAPEEPAKYEPNKNPQPQRQQQQHNRPRQHPNQSGGRRPYHGNQRRRPQYNKPRPQQQQQQKSGQKPGVKKPEGSVLYQAGKKAN